MRLVTETRYAVEGWGVGELWLRGEVVVAHEFEFERETSAQPDAWAQVREGPAPPPPMGGSRPPEATVATILRRVGDASVPGLSPSRPPSPAADELVQRVTRFLAGEPEAFDDVELELDASTPFQRAVTTALRAVPRGEVVTYGELAALAGHPGAQRAVGTFCAGNRFAFVVPCHRVVAADGIGGYGSTGIAVKRRLLQLEGVVL